jgi:transcriptional regulator with XRE-family HTH domain
MDKQEIIDLVANNIRRLMNKNHLSQTDVCDRTGFHIASFGRILKAKHSPSADVLGKLCKAFDVHVGEFFKPTGPVELKPNGRKAS